MKEVNTPTLDDRTSKVPDSTTEQQAAKPGLIAENSRIRELIRQMRIASPQRLPYTGQSSSMVEW